MDTNLSYLLVTVLNMMIADSKLVQSVHRIDTAAFMTVVGLNTRRGFCLAARLISKTADGWIYPLTPLLIAVYSPVEALRLFYVLALGYGIERIIYFVLKKSIKRNRPPNAIPGFQSVINASDEFSFPSGHTSAAFLAVTTLVLVFPGANLHVFYGWAIAVAFSRIILGVHFPLDTIAGAALGSVTAINVFRLLT